MREVCPPLSLQIDPVRKGRLCDAQRVSKMGKQRGDLYKTAHWQQDGIRLRRMSSRLSLEQTIFTFSPLRDVEHEEYSYREKIG